MVSIVVSLAGLYYKREELRDAGAELFAFNVSQTMRELRVKAPAGANVEQYEGEVINVLHSKMSDNKLVKTLTDAATITGITAEYEWVAKKLVKEPLTSDPSTNLVNYVKFPVVVAAASGHQTMSRRSKDVSELNKMLSGIIVSALKFATFCLFVEAAMILLRRQIQQERKEIREEIVQEIREEINCRRDHFC